MFGWVLAPAAQLTQYRQANNARSLNGLPGLTARQRHRAKSEQSCAVLALMVGPGLLLACVNLAGLLLARSDARSKELAVRAARGASRGRLVRDALAEALLLEICGGGIGVAIARWSITVIRAAAPPFLGSDSRSGSPLRPRFC